MLFLIHSLLVLISLIAIIFSCTLFTNAIEHLGDKLKLGTNAIGSILAVIGTTLPETIVPLVAIIGAYTIKTNALAGQNIALGAIIGSPFMLSTLALFLVGVVLVFQKRTELKTDCESILRNYKYFIIAYISAICASLLPSKKMQLIVVLFLLVLYGFFVYRTIVQSKQTFIQEELEELIFFKFFKKKLILLQIIVSLLGLIFFSHIFIEEIEFFSEFLKINPMILSLFISPIATELPECVNSIIWTKQHKDDLAMGNIIGAIVFQAMIPMSIGIILTPWKLDYTVIANVILVLLCSLFFVGSILATKKVKLVPLLTCGIFYFGYLFWILG